MRYLLVFVLMSFFVSGCSAKTIKPIVALEESETQSGPVTISTPRSQIFVALGSEAHVPLFIKIENSIENRKITLDWGAGLSERQLNNPTQDQMKDGREYHLPNPEDKYLTYTDDDFCQHASGWSGLVLPEGEYPITVTLTRITKGQTKEYRAKVTVIVGLRQNSYQ